MKKHQPAFIAGTVLIAISGCQELEAPHLEEGSTTDNPILGMSHQQGSLIQVKTNIGHLDALDVEGIAYFGDIVLGETAALKQVGLTINQEFQSPPDSNIESRASTRHPSSGYRWPGGEIPFVYSSNLTSTAKKHARSAINHWNEKTSVRFIERTTQSDYVSIENGNGCFSYVGRKGGKQKVTLAAGCGLDASIHELGHAVGMFHEHNRQDRDQYVSIYWDNIDSKYHYAFQKVSTSAGKDVGTYDYYSVMHYPVKAFSTNKKVTIWPKKSGIDTDYMGNPAKLSAKDIAAIEKMYGDTGGGSQPNSGDVIQGSLTGSGDEDTQPNGNWFSFDGGQLEATLKGPDGTDFDLRLLQWKGGEWLEIEKSAQPNSNERIKTLAENGYYKFTVRSYSGSGNYTFTVKR